MEIQSKAQIISQLENNYEKLISWFRQHEDENFEKPEKEGKWSAGQHADHLVKSTAPLRQGLAMPKLVLRTTFGINNRPELSYEKLLKKYNQKLAEGGQASGRFLPKEIKNENKYELLQQLEDELDGLKNVMDKWDDNKMSKYILPHPLLGKLSIREMMFFTVLHTEHHFNILKERYE